MIAAMVASYASMRIFATWLIAVSIGLGALFLLVLGRKKRWIARANRLARDSGIDLPSRLQDRVAKRLRNEWLTSLVLYPLVVGPLQFLGTNVGIRGPKFWTSWFPRLAALLPVLGVVYSIGTVVVARWNTPGPTRVSHLRQVRLHEAFTPAESYTLAVGVGTTCAMVAWGLIQMHASVRWWIVDFAAFAVAGALWWLMETAILLHRSTASDEMELGWDDVFRFRRVRSLAIGAAWLPSMFVFVLDSMVHEQLTHFQGGTLWPVYLPIAAAIGVYLIFRQGRQLWRLV